MDDHRRGSPVMELCLPSSDYVDEAVYRRERERIFAREWNVVCRAEEIAAPGGWRVFDVAGESVLVLRGKNGTLNAFYNVCRHRGARLCAPHDEVARTARAVLAPAILPNGGIRCPYHAWTYNSEGTLVGAPFLTDDPAFPRQDFSLYPVGCSEWAGFVFLHLTPAAASPLADQLGPIPGRIANYPLADLRIGHHIRYDVAANWKIICENYNECYHCGPVHPELCGLVPAFRTGGGAGLNWEDGIPHREGAYTFTWSGTTARAAFSGLNAAERVNHKGELVYPNLFLSLACDHVAAYILRPMGAARTVIDCMFLFAPQEITRETFDHSDCSSFWDTVNQQDWAICERVQLGMGSRAHVQGYYAPMENANLDMRKYVGDRMAAKPENSV